PPGRLFPGSDPTPTPPPSPPVLTFAPRGAAPDRPAGAPSCRRCPLEPPPRGAPRRTDRPVPLPAVAARLNLHSAGRRTRATAFTPPLPLPSRPSPVLRRAGAGVDRLISGESASGVGRAAVDRAQSRP